MKDAPQLLKNIFTILFEGIVHKAILNKINYNKISGDLSESDFIKINTLYKAMLHDNRIRLQTIDYMIRYYKGYRFSAYELSPIGGVSIVTPSVILNRIKTLSKCCPDKDL